MPDNKTLQTYMERAEAELRENILPFWIEHAVDEQRGGFYGEIGNDLQVQEDAPRGALLTSRILWTYAAAYRRYRNQAYLNMAHWAYEDLLERFWDDDYGGLYWRVAADGTPMETRKQIYGQAFGIYGLAEYYAATGESTALQKAQEIFQAMAAHSYDSEHKGYLEAFTRDWQSLDDMRLSAVDQNAPKSMNTHLHIMEAYTNLLRVWPDPVLHQRQTELLEVMMTHVIDPTTAQMTLFFDRDWTPRSENVSYGHDIEASWLIVESAEVLNDAELLTRSEELSVRMAQAVFEEGRDPDGAVLYEAGPEGLEDDTKQWWPQAEAVVGLTNAYQLAGEAHFLEAALSSWDFIESYLIDKERGGWFRYVRRDHTLGEDEPKVSFWKCPYHNGRACMEFSERLHTLIQP
jgi:mannobiose 2-epimerase